MNWTKTKLKPKSAKRRLPGIKAALEISRSDLHLVVVDESPAEPHIRTSYQAWGSDDAPLQTDKGCQALTDALRELVDREQIVGAVVRLTLNSDYCITRVISGENEEVARELKSLDDRSSMYLSLGNGENTAAVCTHALDAKNQQAFVTIANKQTLEGALAAAHEVGLHVSVAEHSLVALARAIGILERDVEEPVLILEINDGGVDLGITYRGQLMLDYRPGGTSAKAQIADTVMRHMERLQRYCNKRFQFADGRQLSRIFICGSPDDVQSVREQFAQHSRLQAEVIDPAAVLTRCGLPPDSEMGVDFAPCVATLACVFDQDDKSLAPNLVGGKGSAAGGPLWPAVIKTLWPVAAALLLVCGLMGTNYAKSLHCDWLEQEARSYDVDKKRLFELKMQRNMLQQRTSQLQAIMMQLQPPNWHETLAIISQAMPPGVWLERIQVNADGTMHITGPSQSDDGIFEFVRLLKETTILTNVALESTQPIQFNNVRATRFDIICRLVPRSELQGDKK